MLEVQMLKKIDNDFLFDFENKRISYNCEGSGKSYQVNELYSYIQDLFDEPHNMRFDIPIEAETKTKYFLVNGWTIDFLARKHLRNGLLLERV